jgi:hypothetical protein
MISDSLTFNPNPLPAENTSIFKKFIQSQDEVGSLSTNIYYFGNSKDIINSQHVKQKSLINDSVFCTSMFSQNRMASPDFKTKTRSQYAADWIFFAFLICLIFATIFTFKNNKRISQLFKAFLVPHFTNQLIREGNIMREFFIYPLLLIYFTSLSLLISNILHYFFYFEITINQGLLVFLIVFLFFIFKTSLIKIIGWVFQTNKETFEYLINYMIFSIVIGVFLFPSVFFLIYTTHFISVFLLYVVLIIFAIISVYRAIRGLVIGLSFERYRLYYLFLYLCTVEILPLCISVKLLINFYLTGDFLK